MKVERRGFLVRGMLVASLLVLGAWTASAEQKVYTMDRVVRSGESVHVDVSDRPIRRVNVLVKRLDANDKDCHLTAGFRGESAFDGGKKAQVDRQDLHEVVIMANGARSNGRELEIRVHNGEVNIREVIVHFE